ncbi:hypothetical protein [Umezawaea tangerina]|uniref:hypothetical protein n=1 Tax=Umezawaea tangerina TaxID=84725 RepID=UPI0011B25205|nr:hypothetical protein [Umezawaea tangerina]
MKPQEQHDSAKCRFKHSARRLSERAYLRVSAFILAILASTSGVLALTGNLDEPFTAIFAGTASGGIIINVIALLRDRVASAAIPSDSTRRNFRGAARLLPTAVRDEYQEEWAGWMQDLRESGVPRLQRWLEHLTIILIAAPKLAITLRRAARRAADQ